MKKIIYALVLLTLPVIQTKSQEQLRHTPKMYKSEDGKLYVNKNEPMYLFLGTDPSNTNTAKKLESEESKKYSNPFYFDTEGINTIRTPSQVDPETKQLVYPIADVVFEVYADGIAPTTHSSYFNSPTFLKNNIRYYGKGLKVTLSAKDQTSGVESIYYSIDGQPYLPYKDSLSFTEEKEYTLHYYSIDHVGNIENVSTDKFTIDKTPPIANWKLDGEISGKTASGRSFIELLAEDKISGIKNIKYQIDDKPVKIYSSKIPLSYIATGEHKFKFWVEDNVGNITDKDHGTNNDINVYAFIVDQVAPSASALIEGDQYIGKYLYVSERSKCKLIGEDDQLGISKIAYSYNNKTLDNTYEKPFNFNNQNGVQTLFYRAFDMVSNKSTIETLSVYLDNEAPNTGIDFKGPQLFNRDTMFINSKTEIILITEDNASGVQQTTYAIDKKEKSSGNSFNIKEDGWHKISFSSSDNVNNQEITKESEVVIDNVGPEIFVNFSIKPIRKEIIDGKEVNIYPPFVKMYIGATDIQCGTNSIWYAIDGGSKKNYAISGSPADVQMFKQEKTYTVTIDTSDNLGNQTSKEVTFKVAKK